MLSSPHPLRLICALPRSSSWVQHHHKVWQHYHVSWRQDTSEGTRLILTLVDAKAIVLLAGLDTPNLALVTRVGGG